MKIKIIVSINPFMNSSASANRWRTLIEGLAVYNVAFDLIITGGYSSREEKRKIQNKYNITNVSFNYLYKYINQNIWFRRFNKYILHLFLSFFTIKRIIRIIEKESNVLVWTSSDFDSFKLAKRLRRGDKHMRLFLEMSEFLDIHNIHSGNFFQRKAGDKRQELFEKSAFYAYDGIALMTKTLYNHYQQFPDPKPKLLHLPMTVDLSRFTGLVNRKENRSKPYICFIGSYSNAKDGVDILLKSFATISQKFPDYKLVMHGFIEYDTPGHRQLIKELNIEHKVMYNDPISRDLVPTILANASLLVLPRPKSKQAEGGFPTKLGEYLASGKPVCVTKVGEIPQYLEDSKNAFLAEPSDIDSFSDCMYRALSNPELAIQVGQNGRKTAETQFNMDVQAKNLYEFLKSF